MDHYNGELLKNHICGSYTGIVRKVFLLSRTNVNQSVQGEPLIIHYLRAKVNLKVLRAFAANGCDFKVRGRDGQTLLHLLVAKKLNDNQIEAIDILISHGCDPCDLDNDGNNVLMVAVLMRQGLDVIEVLTKDETIVKQLVTQKNKFSHDVLALSVISGDQETRSMVRLLYWLQLCADITSTDNNGDNCLHHFVRYPDVIYSSIVYYETAGDGRHFSQLIGFRQCMFKSHLNILIEAGADIIQQNKSGLIPLQVPLSSNRLVFESILDLEPLVPDENVLEILVPQPDMGTMVKEPMNLSVQVWLVAQVTRFGFNSSKYTLSRLRASKFCTPLLIEHVIMNHGVNPTAEDMKVPFLSQNWKEFELYLKNMLPEDIGDLKQVIPDVISKVISIGSCDVVEKLVSNRLAVTVNDPKVALDRSYSKMFCQLLYYLDSSLEVQIKRKIPDILFQLLQMYQRSSFRERFYFYKTMKMISNKFNIIVNDVNSSADSSIHCLMDISRELENEEALAVFIFFLWACHGEIYAEQTVKYGNNGNESETIQLTPLQMAMQMKTYSLVATLILVGADCRGIEYDHLRCNSSAIKLLKLLYHLGIYVDIAEGDLIYDWSRTQLHVKPLQELAAMAVRRNCSRKELKEAIGDMVLPDTVSSYLALKHLNLDD